MTKTIQQRHSYMHAAVVGKCSGTQNIAEMWRQRFRQLYNSVHDNNIL